MRRSLSVLALLVVLATGIEASRIPKPLLVWNVTASAPIGLYRRDFGASKRGSWVLVQMPKAVADLASRRRYLPRNVPMVKRIAALSGDTVCRAGAIVRINNAVAAAALARDAQRRPLPVWQGCKVLGDNDVFLLNSPPLSFDSRYFGVVPRANLIERIEPLWTF
jgi:conjugative transfer signal peptidase TraF